MKGGGMKQKTIFANFVCVGHSSIPAQFFMLAQFFKNVSLAFFFKNKNIISNIIIILYNYYYYITKKLVPFGTIQQLNWYHLVPSFCRRWTHG